MKSVEETPTPSVSSEIQVQTDSPTMPQEQVDPLMAEVETFLSKRDELAQRFADEIAATEQKLAELKKTAASLFPESVSSGQTNQKTKKPKAKSAAKSESASSSDSPSSAE